MKRINIIILIIIYISIVFLAIFSILKGVDNDMDYVELYKINGTHITNIIVDKYSITKRVFDYDTSTFEGTTDIDISDAKFFVFKTGTGEYIYSGFVKNITQDEDSDYVKFKGDDLKSIYDSVIELDYSQTDYLTQNENFIDLDIVFGDVTAQIENATGIGPEFSITTPTSAQFNTAFINNPSGRKVVENAWTYLKPYLAYYNYRVDIIYVPSNAGTEHSLSIELVNCNVSNNQEIKLDDFVFDKTTSETSINQILAKITPPDNKTKSVTDEQLHMWTWSSEELFNATPVADQVTIDLPNTPDYATYSLVNFEDSFEDYDLPQAIRIRFWAGTQTGEPDRIIYAQSVDKYDPYESTAELIYYLGNDNNIYYQTISNDKRIIPVKQSIYYAETLSEAQFNGVFDLSTSRYIENIILTDVTDYGPVDIKDLDLYDFIDAYDSDGNTKTLPVSEITMTQDSYKVKLGFKKILLTEIIKGGN